MSKLWWAAVAAMIVGCGQQEKMVEQKERFDPTKHEILRIDTVGVHWGRGFKGMDTTRYKDYATYKWGGGLFSYKPVDSDKVLFVDPIRGMTAIYELDTIFIPLVPLLVSQEEQKAFREWVDSLAAKQPH